MRRFQRMYRLNEAFQYRKFQPGQINFPTSSWQDPFVQKIAGEIAKAHNIPLQEVEQAINHEVAEMHEQGKLVPILHETMDKNAVEQQLFKMFENADIPTNAPKFNTTTFYKLIRNVRADHDEFFPLRGFIDKRRLQNPQFIFVGGQQPKSQYDSVNTAAASPNGDFIFNVNFMQKLLDYAHLKGIKPKGSKYISNGGDIPDEYAYLEFLIMHEFMHYSNDDFYYQKIIPNANNKIINWVGDFRTNYLLVKSGYEPLPIGLYNDSINYDRQKSYIDMYNIVKSEFDKLPESKIDIIGKILDGMSDDHGPGQQQGEQADVSGKDITPDKIDEQTKKITKQMEEAEDSSPADREKKAKADAEKSAKEAQGNQNAGRNPAAHEVDYSKIKPAFNWQTLMKKFIQSATPKMDTTYAKPARRSASGLDIARQVGSAAIKPGEKAMDFADMNLGFVIDSSGSMSSIIATVLSNSMNLLKQPIFAKSQALVFKFSGDYEIYKVNFRSNLAAQVQTFAEKPKNYPLKTSTVLGTHIGSSTDFSAALATEVASAVQHKYNIVMFLDADILAGSNLTNFVNLLKSATRGIFVIFDSRHTYVEFRQRTGFSTPNITHF